MTFTEGRMSHPEGRMNRWEGRMSLTEGRKVYPEGRISCSEGRITCTEGRLSHPEGNTGRWEDRTRVAGVREFFGLGRDGGFGLRGGVAACREWLTPIRMFPTPGGKRLTPARKLLHSNRNDTRDAQRFQRMIPIEPPECQGGKSSALGEGR